MKQNIQQKIPLLLLTLILTLTLLAAGCVTTVTTAEYTELKQTDATDTTDITDITETLAAAVTPQSTIETTSIPADPAALLRGEYFYYMDNNRINDIKVRVVKNSGRIIDAYSYLENSTRTIIDTPPQDGMKYYYVSIEYAQDGLHYADKSGTITTPAVSLHRLTDAQGNTYRPLYLNIWYSMDSINGRYYQPTSLNRLESFTGYLIFEVPQSFTTEGAYLSVKLGKWGTPKWKLWD